VKIKQPATCSNWQKRLCALLRCKLSQNDHFHLFYLADFNNLVIILWMLTKENSRSDKRCLHKCCKHHALRKVVPRKNDFLKLSPRVDSFFCPIPLSSLSPTPSPYMHKGDVPRTDVAFNPVPQSGLRSRKLAIRGLYWTSVFEVKIGLYNEVSNFVFRATMVYKPYLNHFSMCNLLTTKNGWTFALGGAGWGVVEFFCYLAKLLVVGEIRTQGSLEACLLHVTV